MSSLSPEVITDFVEKNIDDFHQARLRSLREVELHAIIKRKNPYLFRAKNILTAADLVRSFLDAHLSSQEETLFGGLLERLAIFVAQNIHGGHKSIAEGIDLEFHANNVHFVVAIKSGPNWANSQQLMRMRDNFMRAKRTLNTNSNGIKVVAVNGCCYGKDNSPDKGDYLKLCGQAFWEFLSDDPDLYTKIIEPLGHRARERNDAFVEKYAIVLNLFSQKFSEEFAPTGAIDWNTLVQFNSGRNVLKNRIAGTQQSAG